MDSGIKTMEWQDGRLYILDQRLLPTDIQFIECTDHKMVFEAIKTLAVRGAPAIGIAAAYGIVLSAGEALSAKGGDLRRELVEAGDYLASSRPTAANLFWAIDRMKRLADIHKGSKPEELYNLLLCEAQKIEEEDVAMCRAIGEWGQSLLPEESVLLTHCNAGSLATAGYGTALGVIYSAVSAGKKVRVFVDETRPLLQGSRLTAWELMQSGIPTTVICDDMAGHVLRDKGVDAVIVGADRIAKNGDVANKVGTYGLAILAGYHRIPFYVAAPTSTIDFSVIRGEDIPIEERDSSEITEGMGKRTAPFACEVYNPAFDVTPARLVSAIITERGIHRPPYEKSLREGESG